MPVIQANSRNGFGMQLDKKLNFEEYFNKIGPKVNKTVGIFCKLQDVLPRSTLLRPHLDYGDIIYDQVFNESFHAKLKSLEYYATLAIIVAIRGSFTEKTYEEFGL